MKKLMTPAKGKQSADRSAGGIIPGAQRRGIFFAIILSVLLMATNLWAVDPSVVTVTYASINDEVSTITWSWKAKSDDGTVTSTACASFKGWVFMATADPGSTPPQASYDIVLNDTDSVDIFGAELNNLSATVSAHAVPKIGSAYYGPRFINGTLTMVLTGNNVNSATGTVKIYYYRKH